MAARGYRIGLLRGARRCSARLCDVKPGERVKLIEEAADSLADRDFPRAQMILDQFGIETYDIDGSWHGAPDEPTYLLQQLGKAGDDTLASLHAFLMGDDAQPETDPLGGPWRVDLPARAFLSHRHENRLLGLPRLWLTSLTRRVASWEGCSDAQEVPSRVQA